MTPQAGNVVTTGRPIAYKNLHKELSVSEPHLTHTNHLSQLNIPMPDANIFPHATNEAAKTVEKHQEPQDLVFWSGWVKFAHCLLYFEFDDIRH